MDEDAKKILHPIGKDLQEIEIEGGVNWEKLRPFQTPEFMMMVLTLILDCPTGRVVTYLTTKMKS